MTNEELAIQIKAGINVSENMAALWQQNRGFIGQIAGRYRSLEEEDDLIQEGYMGLCKAVDGFDPGRGVSFLTYAAHWIKQAMLRYIQNNGTVRIPVNRQGDIRKYERLVSDFCKHHGRKPKTLDIAWAWGVSYKEIKSLEKMSIWSYIASIDAPIGEDGETLGALISADGGMENDLVDNMDLAALREILWAMVDELPDCQPEVIRARFRDCMTRNETAKIIHETAVKVRDIELKAMRELRRNDRINRLRPYAEEVINTYAFRGCGVGIFNRTWNSSTERAALKLFD